MAKPKKKRANKLLVALLLALFGAACGGALWLSGSLDGLEGWSFDLRAQNLANTELASPEIVLILLDQQSLDWAKEQNSWSWPWAREIYGVLADFCASGGAKSLAMDVVFTEPSGNGVADDSSFAEAVANAGNVVSALTLFRGTGGSVSWPISYAKRMPALENRESWFAGSGKNTARSSVSFNIPEYDIASAAFGNVIFDPDRDGVFRRVPPLCYFDGAFVPSLGLAAYLQASGITSVSYGDKKLTIGNRTIPVDAEGNAVLRFNGPSLTHKAYNAAEVLQSAAQRLSGETPKLDPAVFKDKYVFFGFTAAGLYDLRPSPMAKTYTGVEIHATFLDNLLGQNYITEIPKLWNLVILFALCFLASLMLVSVKKTWLQGILYAAYILLPVGLAFGLYSAGIWFLMMPSMLCVLVSLAGAGLYNYATEGRQKAFIKSAFKQYLSPLVIEQLIANPDKLNLGGERRMLTIFFSDLQGFTSLSEALTPEDLTSVLNEYLSAMTEIIHDEGGTVDKYEGDAIIAFWNAPLDVPDHGVRAVRAALRCQDKLAEMRPALATRTGKELYMRVGLNSGLAVVGNMGSKTRFDYTMLGDSVNLAARLEGVNKQFGTYTMISEHTLKELGDAFAMRELSRIAVVGKKIPVRVFEPMRHDEYEARRETLETFHKGLQAYYGNDFKTALDFFASIEKIDAPARNYLEKCRDLAQHPPANFDGVWVMTSK